jgi:predicted enzyme related to lactoylglutathione lyase
MSKLIVNEDTKLIVSAIPVFALSNALGYLRVMFTVEDIDEMVFRLSKHGAQLVGEVVQYENSYRLCYIRGTEGLLIGLAEEIGRH